MSPSSSRNNISHAALRAIAYHSRVIHAGTIIMYLLCRSSLVLPPTAAAQHVDARSL